jgi:hypothetical protein
MTTPVSDVQQTTPPPEQRRGRRWPWVLGGAIVAVLGTVVLVVALAFVGFHVGESRPLPSFPSLAEHPDPSVQGTVAYYASDTGCVRIGAASGQPSKDVLCLPKESVSKWLEQGKPAGPQLVWRDDGRLEVTMFRWKPDAKTKSAPALMPGWQKIVDVRTGRVEDVPAAQVPSTPNTTTEPTASAAGEQINVDFDASTGKAKVTLTGSAGTRTLLSVHGPGEYTYRFGPVFWAPNWQWIAASDDGRILVITPTDPPVTRVLVTGTGGGAGGGSAGPEFAVTTTNFLTPAG